MRLSLNLDRSVKKNLFPRTGGSLQSRPTIRTTSTQTPRDHRNRRQHLEKVPTSADLPDRSRRRRGYPVPLHRDRNLGRRTTTTMPITTTLLDWSTIASIWNT